MNNNIYENIKYVLFDFKLYIKNLRLMKENSCSFFSLR